MRSHLFLEDNDARAKLKRSIYTKILLMYMKINSFFYLKHAAVFISVFAGVHGEYPRLIALSGHRSWLDMNRLPSEFFPE